MRFMLERRETGLRHQHVVLGSIEARPDPSDHLSVEDDRQAALHLDEAVRRDGRDASVIDRILQCRARLLGQRAVRALPGASSTAM